MWTCSVPPSETLKFDMSAVEHTSAGPFTHNHRHNTVCYGVLYDDTIAEDRLTCSFFVFFLHYNICRGREEAFQRPGPLLLWDKITGERTHNLLSDCFFSSTWSASDDLFAAGCTKTQQTNYLYEVFWQEYLSLLDSSRYIFRHEQNRSRAGFEQNSFYSINSLLFWFR